MSTRTPSPSPSLKPNDHHQRCELAAKGAGIVTDLSGWLASAACGWAFFSSQNCEAPRFSITLELLVAKIEEEMLLSIGLGTDIHPILSTLLKQQIAAHLVKLPPGGRQFAEPTLATIPTLVIHRTKSISPAVSEPKLANIFFLELWVTERIQQERQHNIELPHPHLWARSIRLRIPVRI